jgi:hypothetical protein
MAEKYHDLKVASADREAFALCLALGTLEAMRSGAWPLDAGIGTLARPVFYEPLEATNIPDEVLAVFRGADELSALASLAGRATAERKLDEWIAVLKSRLSTLPDRSWYARWSKSD